MIPRGIRNNNPGNIEYNGTKWHGLTTPPSDGRFCIFTTPQWGIRALAIILRNYRKKHGITTIRGIISRFAPANENNTAAYIASVASALGTDADTPLDWCNNQKHLAALVRAIIRHENGQMPYSEEQITAGLES